jgi:Papain-like cysteine protease AvrRpt2
MSLVPVTEIQDGSFAEYCSPRRTQCLIGQTKRSRRDRIYAETVKGRASMANFYNDSHGERWGVMMQQKKVSCGLACAAMAEVYMKSQVAENMEATFRAMSQKFPENFKEDRGASMDNIVDVLRYRGTHCYNNYNYGSGGVWPYLYTYAKDTTPVIVYISWGPGAGAHATLCVYVYKSDQKCIFLDPGYGLVELDGSQLPAYTVRDNTGIYSGAVIARGTLTGPMIITRA